ncbi:unnamed protein product, partial [marine sediment metagenome]
QKELQFSKRLNFITNKINSSKDIDDILINLREDILSLFDADRLTIYVVDGISKEMQNSNSWPGISPFIASCPGK